MADNQVEYIVRAQDQASAVLNHIAGGVNDLSGMFQTLARSFGPIGAITAGFVAMGTAVAAGSIALADEVEQLDRLSSISGVSVDNLQVMKQVLSEAGGDADGLPKALVKLNRAIQDGDPMLARIGVTSKDTWGAFKQLAGVITESTDAKARDEVATHLLGKAGADLIPDLEALIKSFNGIYAAMASNESLMKGDLVDSTRHLDSELDTLSRNWSTAMTHIQAVTVPVISTLISGFNDMWAAISGSSHSEAEVDRRIGEARAHIASLEAEAFRHGDPDWNRNTMAEWDRTLQRLVKEKAVFERSRPNQNPVPLGDRLKPPPSPPPDALAIANRGWFVGKPGASATDRVNADIARRADESSRALANMGKNMEELVVPVLKATDAGEAFTRRLELVESALMSMGQSIAFDLSGAAAEALSGSTNIRQVWHELMRALRDDLVSNFADFGIGLLFDLLPLPGASEVAGKIAHTFSSTPARGGDTYNISALSARDVLEELTSPTGSMRNANDYVRTVSRASSR